MPVMTDMEKLLFQYIINFLFYPLRDTHIFIHAQKCVTFNHKTSNRTMMNCQLSDESLLDGYRIKIAKIVQRMGGETCCWRKSQVHMDAR